MSACTGILSNQILAIRSTLRTSYIVSPEMALRTPNSTRVLLSTNRYACTTIGVCHHFLRCRQKPTILLYLTKGCEFRFWIADTCLQLCYPTQEKCSWFPVQLRGNSGNGWDNRQVNRVATDMCLPWTILLNHRERVTTKGGHPADSW